MLAHLVEHLPGRQKVAGSIPAHSTLTSSEGLISKGDWLVSLNLTSERAQRDMAQLG